MTCDLATNMCITTTTDAGIHCILDDECESRVCQLDGLCALAQDILYVDPVGIAAGECTSVAPCELYYATTLISPKRFLVRLGNGVYQLDSGLVVGVLVSDLTIVGGRSAVLQRTTSGPVLEARDGATLTLRGVSLNKGVACSNFAHLNVSRVSFSNPGNEQDPWINLNMCSTATVTDSDLLDSLSNGINAAFGGELTVIGSRITGSATNGVNSTGQRLIIIRSTINGNQYLGVRASVQTLTIHRSTVSSNRGGGISGTGGIFDITNNFVFRNGNDTNSEFGGLRLDTNLPGNRVIQNTIVRNDSNPLANPLYAGGFFCRGGGSFVNNLIVNNFAGAADQHNAQIGGTCDLTGSQISNEDVTSKFVSPVALPFNYHLADMSSRAVNSGIIGPAPETEDFDGDLRNDGAPDVGADELKP